MTSGDRRDHSPPRGDRAPKTQAGSASGLGLAVALTGEQLDQAAVVTPTDLATAKALWRTAAPPTLRDLLDAESDSST